MTKPQRQLAMLGALLAVMAAAGVLRSGGAVATDAPATLRAAPPAGAPRGPVQVLGVHLELLATKPDDIEATSRNPFRFQPKPAPAPAPRVAPVVVRVDPISPPVPAGPPPPPPIPLKFIGVLDAPTRLGRLAILSDSRGGVFYGKEGDTIEGRYRVLSISTESAELVYMDGRGRQTIRLSGQ